MAKSRLGKKDSIFKSTTGPKGKGSATSPAVGAKPVGTSIENKTTVILPPDQVAFLDRLCLDVRAKTGWKARRTEVIRALVGALQASDLDLTSAGSEVAMAEAIRANLKK